MIGPTFTAELDAAGISNRRFTWGPDGALEFHRDMPESEREKVLAVLSAHDGPLSEARHQALLAVRTEAARRIAEMFGQAPESFDLVFAEINTLARAVWILGKGTSAHPEETADLAALKRGWALMQATRDIERATKAAILAAKTVQEVQTVSPVWPPQALPQPTSVTPTEPVRPAPPPSA